VGGICGLPSASVCIGGVDMGAGEERGEPGLTLFTLPRRAIILIASSSSSAAAAAITPLLCM